MCGSPGQVPALATRIAGSSDLYQHNGRRPCNSINFITSHDGFTLADLVSYNEKHNLVNGEDNRDGDNNNLSWNSGSEGDTDNPKIQALRNRRCRTMAVILFLSQGVPMLVAGDEFGRSQQGNNNAWCQDNEINWINWQMAEKNKGQLRFFKKLIRLRRDHPIFRRLDFFEVSNRPDEPPHMQEISWQGLKPGEQDWSDDCHTLAFFLKGSELRGNGDANFFVMLNGHREQEATFIVPKTGMTQSRCVWKKIIDTGCEAPTDFVDPGQAELIAANSGVTIAPMGCVVLQSQEVVRR
jgi:glycogen operon protein